MDLIIDKAVIDHKQFIDNAKLKLNSKLLNSNESKIELKNCIAYPPLINSHDHLIGNWFPHAVDSDIYPNAHIWVQEMKKSEPVKERDRIWVNTIPMSFYRGNGKLLALLGGYKNIFSGVNTVQDHAPVQVKDYYDMYPINVLRKYRQCHSLEFGNFWGGEECVKELELTNGKSPFILHLGEGVDPATAKEFAKLKEMQLLQPNTILIHAIALTESDIKECAEIGTSICWCPYSNYTLIGKTVDVKTCIKYGVNMILGTDSTLTGSANLLEEMKFTHRKFPDLEADILYKMVSTNSAKALYLDDDYLENYAEKGNLLIMKSKNSNPYKNLLEVDFDDIVLFMHNGTPLFGINKMLKYFNVKKEDYYIYVRKGVKYFIIGHPEDIMQKINTILGYEKELPYIPFLR